MTALQLEKLLKKKAPRKSLPTAYGPDDSWLTRTMEIFAVLEPMSMKSSSRNTASTPSSSMILRDRKPKSAAKTPDNPASRDELDIEAGVPAPSSAAEKKLPKVVLKLGPRPMNP
jgi:hypothetical protein